MQKYLTHQQDELLLYLANKNSDIKFQNWGRYITALFLCRICTQMVDRGDIVQHGLNHINEFKLKLFV